MRQILGLLFIGVFSRLVGQDTTAFVNEAQFGISPFITLSPFTEYNKSPVGVGADLFYNYPFKSDYIQGKIGYKRYQYVFDNRKSVTEDLHLVLSYQYTIPKATGLRVTAGYSPAFIFNATNRFMGKQDSIATVTYTKQLKNRLSHGLYLGVSLQSKSNSSFDIGYSHILNKTVTNGFYDAIPNHITFAYTVNFNKKGKANVNTAQTRSTLTKLKNDTLYFINKSCATDFSNAQLDSLLAANYKYSAYKVLDEQYINATSKQSNVLHFAIIGNHYAGYGDPLTTGIYLLDGELKSTEFPYPYHTTNPKNGNGFSKCIGSLENAAALIRVFNNRLNFEPLSPINPLH